MFDMRNWHLAGGAVVENDLIIRRERPLPDEPYVPGAEPEICYMCERPVPANRGAVGAPLCCSWACVEDLEEQEARADGRKFSDIEPTVPGPAGYWKSAMENLSPNTIQPRDFDHLLWADEDFDFKGALKDLKDRPLVAPVMAGPPVSGVQVILKQQQADRLREQLRTKGRQVAMEVKKQMLHRGKLVDQAMWARIQEAAHATVSVPLPPGKLEPKPYHLVPPPLMGGRMLKAQRELNKIRSRVIDSMRAPGL